MEFYGYEVVKDRSGKKHKVYSVMIKDRMVLSRFLETYNPDTLFLRLMQPKLDIDDIPERDADNNIVYDDEPVNELVEIIALALDGKESTTQINQWLDLDIANEIIAVTTRLSQFKKKVTMEPKKQTGEA